jgi:hypothetical protein
LAFTDGLNRWQLGGTFRGELRTAQAGGRAGLALRAASPGRSTPPQAASPDPWEDPANHIAFAPVSPDDQ